MNVSLTRIASLELAARALLLQIMELRKEAEDETPESDETKPPSTDGASDQNVCPVKCVARYRIAVPVMGHPSRTKCRMCGATYE